MIEVASTTNTVEVIERPTALEVAYAQQVLEVTERSTQLDVTVLSPALEVVEQTLSLQVLQQELALTVQEQNTTVEVQPVEVQVVSVGVQGPPGPPASGTAQAVTYLAGEAVGGQRIVLRAVDGRLYYADHAQVTHAHKVLGITTGAAAVGAPATAQTYGPMTEPSWNWILDEPVFLGTQGLLTQTPPTSGFVLQVGFPLSATELFVDIGDAVILN